MEYRPTIGLEVHAELNTRTKMFCSCANDPEASEPNIHVCPICLAHPGTLPVPNREAVRHVLRVGSALSGTLATAYSEFDRKSYFYPDIPKGYQISQYAYPLVSGGMLAGVPVTRIHLEEDTARSAHTRGASVVDFNRAGIPLMELVTEPEIHDAETAGRFARELQLLLRTLDASKANLEKGEMRIEANISVSNGSTLGTKVEVKNINSFRSVERAITFEIARQIALLNRGEQVVQETRGWEENKQETFHQRRKEGSADYRYFPEPDIPKLILSETADLTPQAIAQTLPELPWQRRDRYATHYTLKEEDIAFLIETPARSAFFDAVIDALDGDAMLVLRAAHYIVSDLAGWYAKNGGEEYAHIQPTAFAALIRMTARNTVSSRGAKDILALMAAHGGEPETLARAHGLLQTQDRAALEQLVQAVIAEHQTVADEYRAGKESALHFLVGQSMKAARGSGNPALITELLVEALAR
ncbi:MAG: glutaminyl-tRNA synthase (glutamine-hydrolyzing) subunit B [Parcubacteria group bacterium 21-54-25]|nr:MAG: glutaminyl-tRNA synthase (glutamine-hydrolyzing) subunit B [Parcubacteria group bacterium 21-54-25]HQU07435.1 Asp-tRNA(Asn)/Glu-tRNA(Gln) amidotransferase subunit GatB [Candidatus Paceibacterota bacterium]